MKKLYLLLLSVYLLFCLDSCRQSDEFELKGELEGITSDMILVVFDDPESKLDTIYPREGKFTYTFTPDTLNIFRLVNDSGETFPIFAEKGWKVSIKGSLAHPEIKGEGANKMCIRDRPDTAPINEISRPSKRKIRTICRSLAPKLRSVTTSSRLSIMSMDREPMTLKQAIIRMKVKNR